MSRSQDNEDFLYDVFLSYASDPDYQLVRELEIFLETFHETPTPSSIELRPLQACVDGSDFTLPKSFPKDDPALELPSVVESYLEASRFLLVLCSGNAKNSAWVNKEIAWFLENRPYHRILLSVTEGVDPIAVPEEVFPKVSDTH